MTQTREERRGAVARRCARSVLRRWATATAALLALAGAGCGSAANTSPGISPSVTSEPDSPAPAMPATVTSGPDTPPPAEPETSERVNFAAVHGWIVYGKSGGPEHLTNDGTWVLRGEGIWAVNPERPGHREDRVRLSEQAGDPIAWSADGSALLILRAWSPDGTPLSKRGSFGKPGVSIGLVVLHADGTETRAVTIDVESGYFGGSSLSPDGSQVVYEFGGQDELHSTSGIYVVDAEGGTPRLLRASPGEIGSPAVSPDGTRIAYFDGSDFDGFALKVMNADGTNVRVLVGHNQPPMKGLLALASEVVWSPDGSHLAFRFVSIVEDRGKERGKDSGIWVIRANGSGLRRVIPGGANPSWSPDGSRIAYRHAGALYVANRGGTHARMVANGFTHRSWFQGSVTWNPLPLSAPS